MIIGIGSDIIDIRRIEHTLARFGDRFINRIYTEKERARAERRPDQRAATYAKRFAAKEATSKALGTGLKQGVFWRDMGVTNLRSGQPTMKLDQLTVVEGDFPEKAPPGTFDFAIIMGVLDYVEDAPAFIKR